VISVNVFFRQGSQNIVSKGLLLRLNLELVTGKLRELMMKDLETASDDQFQQTRRLIQEAMAKNEGKVKEEFRR
jgi:hypothetical protein